MARNKYPEVTLKRILKSAERLFLEKGYDNTTIQEILNAVLGIGTQGRNYRHGLSLCGGRNFGWFSYGKISERSGGSIFSACNMWINPMIFPVSEEKFRRKIQLL